MNESVLKFYRQLGLLTPPMESYLKDRITLIDEKYETHMSFIGTYSTVVDGVLKELKVIIPKGDSFQIYCMQVHEVGHFIQKYPYLGKPIERHCGNEIFPIAMERLFIEQSEDSKLISWFNQYQYDLMEKALEHKHQENCLGFLHHFEYLELCKETNSFPELIDFKISDQNYLFEELKEKAKGLQKSI